jgi:hypothetical protein
MPWSAQTAAADPMTRRTYGSASTPGVVPATATTSRNPAPLTRARAAAFGV